MTRTNVTEAANRLVAETVSGKPGRLQIRVISPGWGSSGYYSPGVLEAAVADKVFAKGTHLYFDHPSATEQFDRPERSVRDLAAVIAEDATRDGDDIVTEVEVIGPYRDLLTDQVFIEAIGMSIRAAAEVTEGEAEGKRGPIIEKLIPSPITSVDFVTHAGRGGAVLGVLESARPATVLESARRRGVSEASVNDRREALSTILRDAYSDDSTWVWLRDFDDTTCWFDIESGDDSGTWQQTYTTGDDGLPSSLTGDRTEVRVVTQYVPATPAGQPNTQESKEDTMATTQIEETELSGLREKASRVTTLESERDTAVAERDDARRELAEARRGQKVADVIGAVEKDKGIEFTKLERVGLTVDVPLTESGDLDAEKFKTAVETAAAEIAEANGAGSVRGFGRRTTTDVPKVSEADLDAAGDSVFGTVTKEA